MGVFKRPAMIAAAIGAAGAIAAGAAIPSQAATTSGVRYLQTQTVMARGDGGDCDAVVLSAAISDGGSAYASAMVSNSLTTACTGWLESSVNGGAWTDVSPEQTLPAENGGVNYPVWYKTGNYYAGPGTSVRACIEVHVAVGAAPLCSKAVTLAASSAQPADDGTPVYYAQHHQPANIVSGEENCLAWVSGSTSAKTSTTQANMVLNAMNPLQTCTAWLETSSDKGQTWQQATPTYSTVNSNTLDPVEYAFSAPVADGTGELARACAKVNTKEMCSSAW